jgi:hypothetical protein
MKRHFVRGIWFSIEAAHCIEGFALKSVVHDGMAGHLCVRKYKST